MIYEIRSQFCVFQPENLRLRIIGRLKSLTLLDGSCVSETEATGALRIAAGSRISHLSLLTHTRTDNNKPRSLSLLTTPHILEKISRSKPEKINEHDSHWFLKVEIYYTILFNYELKEI